MADGFDPPLDLGCPIQHELNSSGRRVFGLGGQHDEEAPVLGHVVVAVRRRVFEGCQPHLFAKVAVPDLCCA